MEIAQLNALIDRRFNDPFNDSGEDTEADKLARARHRYWALSSTARRRSN